jgi:hypothetical protein
MHTEFRWGNFLENIHWKAAKEMEGILKVNLRKIGCGGGRFERWAK